MKAGLTVPRHLFEHSVEPAEVYPTGTRFTPIGTDGDTLKVLAEAPDGTDSVERNGQGFVSTLQCPRATPEYAALATTHAGAV